MALFRSSLACVTICTTFVVASRLIVPGSAIINEKDKAPDPKPKIKMNVEYQKKEGNLLKIALSNEGEEFECFSAKLPWRHYWSMTLILARPNGQVIEFHQYIDDPNFEKTRLGKNEKITGTINLDKRYPKLSEILSEEDVDLFWSYQLTDLNKKKTNRMGGWVYLPKTKTKGEK
jgi:hypothetical protein